MSRVELTAPLDRATTMLHGALLEIRQVSALLESEAENATLSRREVCLRELEDLQRVLANPIDPRTAYAHPHAPGEGGRPMHTNDDFTNPPPRRAAGLALIRSTDGRVLLVEKAYKTGRERFGLVGGSAKPGEPAAIACQREVFEETGLSLVPGVVLNIHYMPANGDVKEGHNVIFNCGMFEIDEEKLILPPDELSGFRWVTRDEMEDLVAPYQAWRIGAALDALAGGPVVYLVGHPPTSES
ncbi:NUDIX domain-containing protein [Streptomyces xiamenensis]